MPLFKSYISRKMPRICKHQMDLYYLVLVTKKPWASKHTLQFITSINKATPNASESLTTTQPHLTAKSAPNKNKLPHLVGKYIYWPSPVRLPNGRCLTSHAFSVLFARIDWKPNEYKTPTQRNPRSRSTNNNN